MNLQYIFKFPFDQVLYFGFCWSKALEVTAKHLLPTLKLCSRAGRSMHGSFN